MSEPVIQDEDRRAVRAEVARRLGLAPHPFVEQLVDRTLRRWPELPAVEAEDPEAPAAEGPAPAAIDVQAASAWVTEELGYAVTDPLFDLVRRVAVERDDRAFEQLMGTLDSQLRLRGIVYRHGIDPDAEYPALWGRIWEAIAKWDGRDFRAYVARITRNHCLDEIARRKRGPLGLGEDDPGDVRPSSRTQSTATSRDAMSFVMEVVGDLEGDGRLKAVDVVIFHLIAEGRAVSDVLAAFHGSPALPALERALDALAAGKRLEPGASIALRLLLDGATPAAAAAVTGHDEGALAAAAAALADLAGEEDRALAWQLARPGLARQELPRARGLNANALNLLVNRTRLKVWMGVLDRAWETLERRGRLDAVDAAIAAHRCTHPVAAVCHMYKGRACKRAASAGEIARKASLPLGADALDRRLDALRTALLDEGLGLAFPDYDACMNERKPEPAARAKGPRA